MSQLPNKSDPQIILLSDSYRMAGICDSYLSSRFRVAAYLVSQSKRPNIDLHHNSLIVLALSSPSSDPVIVLLKAELVGYISQVPILIISRHPFESQPDELIWHLGLPLNRQGLYECIDRIIESRAGGINQMIL